MYRVTVKDVFSAAHFIENYHGKCENMHGHNYTVRVSVEGERLDAGGMLIDFDILKEHLKRIIGPLDHTLLNGHPWLKKRGVSAEFIAEYIYGKLGPLPEGIRIASVEVGETERNTAVYIPPEG